MDRHLNTQLMAWKSQKTRKPLILQGARQVGKTFLLETFANTHFRKTILIDFNVNGQVKKIFDTDQNPVRIMQELSIFFNQDIDPKLDLIFFDEIQLCSQALASLKYFFKAYPEGFFCAAGSLLGLGLSEHDFPVGKIQSLHLYPMTFLEFLNGMGEQKLTQYLSEYKLGQTISAAIHEKSWNLLKHYFVTGGLPEVVEVYKNNQGNLFKAFTSCRELQKELLANYLNDFAKHSGNIKALRIESTFKSVPRQLARENKSRKFNFKDVLPNNSKYATLEGPIQWLIKAGLIYKVPICKRAEPPLVAYTDENAFNLYLFDLGILGVMNELSVQSVLNFDFGSYKGYFAENFILIELRKLWEKDLVSWKENESELEFLVELGDQIIPLEVKSGDNIRARSLKIFVEKYAPQKRIIFSAQMPRYGDNTYYLPLYLASALHELSA